MIKFSQKGDFKSTNRFLKKVTSNEIYDKLDSLCIKGVFALMSNTPIDTGKTAESWDYEIHITKGGINIYWTNSNENQGIPIAILIQYGHATTDGYFIEGLDFINPAIKPVFKEIADEIWKEVTK